MSLKRNYSFNLLLTASNVLFPIIAFPYVSRILAPEGIGQVQFVISFAQYFAIVGGLGIPIYGISEIAKVKKDQSRLNILFSELFSINLLSSLFLSAVYLVVIFSVSEFSDETALFLVGGLIILLSSLNFDWLFNGLEDFRLVALRSVFIKLVSLVFLLTMVNSKDDALIYLSIMTFMLIGNNLLNLLLIKNKVRFVRRGLMLKRHISPLLFILSTTFAATIYTNLDKVILGFLHGDAEVGLYTAGSRLSKAIIPFITAFCAVLLPKTATSIEEKKPEEELGYLKQSFSFISLLAVPILLGLIFLRQPIIILFSGEAFASAADSLLYLSSLPLLIGYGYFFAYQLLVPRGLSKGMFIAAIWGLLFFTIGQIVLVPDFGFRSSALVIALTELIVTAIYIYYSPREIIQKLPWAQIPKALLAALTFFPIIKALELLGLSDIFFVLLSIVCCGLSYFAIQHKLFKNAFVTDLFSAMKNKLHA